MLTDRAQKPTTKAPQYVDLINSHGLEPIYELAQQCSPLAHEGGMATCNSITGSLYTPC